jgi:hypothetical protein
MLYLRQHKEDGSYDNTRYIEYLRGIDAYLPPDLKDLSSLARARFGGAATMYDSYISGYHLKYATPVIVRGNQRRLDLTLTLTGRWDDRQFHIRYLDVTAHASQQPVDRLGRLYIAELAIVDGTFRHEIDFHNGHFVVECSSLSFEEELLKKQ